MAVAQSSIEWTDSTWSPLTGCTKVSPGCDRCYAETMHERFNGKGSFATVTLRPERLTQPLKWRKPRRIFVNSMSDLFHQDVPDEYIARVFAVMAASPQHTFQILTKRHARMRSLLGSGAFTTHVADTVYLMSTGEHADVNGSALVHRAARTAYAQLGAVAYSTSVREIPWPLPNVWIGVSVEDQQWAETRIPALLQTPAAVRWISAEPLLGPIDLRNLKARNGALIDCLGGDVKASDGREIYSCTPSVLDWVVAGGESGPGARPMHPDWARSLRDQCQHAHAAFLFKQAGSVLAREWGGKGKGGDPADWPEPFPRDYPDVAA